MWVINTPLWWLGEIVGALIHFLKLRANFSPLVSIVALSELREANSCACAALGGGLSIH